MWLEWVPKDDDLEWPKKTILVIDDDEMMRGLLTAQLERNGYKVKTADNWKDGIEICKKEKIDLVILDHWLQDITGLEVIDELMRNCEKINAIMISGKSLTKHLPEGIEFMQKPFTKDELLDTINKILSREGDI